MKDLIAHLKKNWYPFGAWPESECYGKELGEAMQAKAIEIGPGEFEFYNNDREWKPFPHDDFYYVAIARLLDSYTEPVEDKYELCEITNEGETLCYYRGEVKFFLNEAPKAPDYAGCLYEDGNIGPMPPMYSVKGSTNRGYFAPFAELKAGNAHILKATHVVFEKGD